ncbi:MAG TPA: class II fructose-bisphosphate aldolase [Anaerolineae bacterium]|nr:class II fructose-bisphosphate aldolase [Anaerolineae bacterium]HRV93751.1 class II fructose-bisphosphate aldolase [Anaerolineae bacterium]
MSIVSLPEIMGPAFEQRYGVAAFNAVDDITMEGVIRAAELSRSPLIIQISVKTVKFWGAEVIKDTFTNMAKRVAVPVTLHLDHCPDPEVAKTCLEVGWNSVLFDGSGLSYDENFQKTLEMVKLAQQSGASVEGELVTVGGVEDGVGSEEEGELLPIEKEIEFIQETGIYCYAPPIGTAHGFYKAAPSIRYDRMEELVTATQMPMVLHGGSGLTNDVFKRLIALGAAKVNISTDLKKTYADGFRTYLEAYPTKYDPLKLITAVRDDVVKMAQMYFKIFGSEGKA